MNATRHSNNIDWSSKLYIYIYSNYTISYLRIFSTARSPMYFTVSQMKTIARDDVFPRSAATVCLEEDSRSPRNFNKLMDIMT